MRTANTKRCSLSRESITSLSNHAGFGTAVRKGITVNVQDRVQVDFVIGVSSVQQQVVVTETTAELQTQSAEVAG